MEGTVPFGSPLTPLPGGLPEVETPRETSPAPEGSSWPVSWTSNPFQVNPPTDNTLSEAISLLARTLRDQPRQEPMANEKGNVRDPDQYDGSDTTKLCPFLAQLELVFKARPRTFALETKKVTYAISYLKGTALQWFEPYLLESQTLNPPNFMVDFEAFKNELRTNFGPYDAVGTAENDLENL